MQQCTGEMGKFITLKSKFPWDELKDNGVGLFLRHSGQCMSSVLLLCV